MAIHDLFSKRQKRLRGEVPEIFIYDEFKKGLKIQIIHILQDSYGYHNSNYNRNRVEDIFMEIRNILSREYEVFRLNSKKSYESEVLEFFLEEQDVEKSLDVVELTFKIIDSYVRNDYHYKEFTIRRMEPDDAISELNDRFKEHGFGYQYESGEIIRVDSTYVHSEIVKPTLNLLFDKDFEGANEEYLKAHEHYRHGYNKECLSECLKSFESTMKIICTMKGWTYNENDTSRKLINICFQNQLVPSFIQNQFTSLQNLLESGVPTIRNKLGGHGQGDTPKTVDDEMTRYALNLTGTNIIFLIEQSKL